MTSTIKTVNDLAKWEHEQIVAKQADGTYSYDTLQALIVERDAMVVSERVIYHDHDGNENWDTISGNAQERREKKAAFIREQEQMDSIASYTRATKDRI